MLIGIDASRALRIQPTGTERYARAIIYHLLALPTAADHQWRLYVDRTPTATERAELIPSPAPNVAIRTLSARRLWTHCALAREVVQHPPDVLFIPSHVIPFVWPRYRLPPSVVTIHDLGYKYWPETHTYGQQIYLCLSTAWSAHSATRVIAVSRATASDLHKFHRLAESKVHVVYEATHPIEPSAHSAAQRDRAAVCTRYDLPRPYALYIGTIQPRKNLARLIEAYARLHSQSVPAWDLVLAGAPGWLNQTLESKTRALGVAEHVRFLGYVADSDLPALLCGARFFCFPSLFEGFGLPILEAQSYGVPVMTANNSSLPEIAGDAALLVDPTDVDAIAAAMLRLSQDEALRQQLIVAGYENVKRFSWKKAARETLAILEAAARGRDGAQRE